MRPRSANDKEYFAQDCFIDRLRTAGLGYQQQGRNSYPDFWVSKEAQREGYEIKSHGVYPGHAQAGGAGVGWKAGPEGHRLQQHHSVG
jgi:hypothetical protein